MGITLTPKKDAFSGQRSKIVLLFVWTSSLFESSFFFCVLVLQTIHHRSSFIFFFHGIYEMTDNSYCSHFLEWV